MTKKSESRRMRDHIRETTEANEKKKAQLMEAAKKQLEQSDNKCWDELNEINASCKRLLASHGTIGAELKNRELQAELENPQLTAKLIVSLTEDIRTMAGELQEIAQLHEGRTGGTTDPLELVNSIQIHNQYHLFTERHQGVIIPTVHYILEHIDVATKKLSAKKYAEQQAAAATDPNVVTDVAFKEVSEAGTTTAVV